MLVPVSSMTICQENAKLLEVTYYMPKGKAEASADVVVTNMKNHLLRKFAGGDNSKHVVDLASNAIHFWPQPTVEHYNLMELRMEGLKASSSKDMP